MTVQELINELEQFDPEMEVHFAYNYGDYWKTIVAPKVSNVDMGLIKHSDYHSMDKVVDEEDETEAKEVVIINL